MFIRLNKAKILRSASCLLLLFVIANVFAPHRIILAVYTENFAKQTLSNFVLLIMFVN